jgi:hypothetical protein
MTHAQNLRHMRSSQFNIADSFLFGTLAQLRDGVIRWNRAVNAK